MSNIYKKLYRTTIDSWARRAHKFYYGEHLSLNERNAIPDGANTPTADNNFITATTTDSIAADVLALETSTKITSGTPVNAVSSDDIILTFTDDSADGEYFEFGDDLYEIEVATVVTDENWTAPAAIGLSAVLAHIPIETSVVVQDSTDTTTYTEDVDYSIDYDTGDMTLLGGSIATGVTCHVDYNWVAGPTQTGAISVVLVTGAVTKEDAGTALTAAVVASGTEDWSAADGADGTVTFSADTAGVINNGLVTDATNAAHASFDTATSVNGVDGTVGDAGAMLYDATNIYVAKAANTIADANWTKLVLQSL